MVDKQSLLISSRMGRKAGSFANLNWSLWFSLNQGKVINASPSGPVKIDNVGSSIGMITNNNNNKKKIFIHIANNSNSKRKVRNF